MATIEVDDAPWTAFCDLCERLEIQDPNAFLEGWLWRIVRHEQAAGGRYLPVACAIVTRSDAEVLLVGNEYARGKPLVWNLPGGAVQPGEDLRHAAARELREESGLEAQRLGSLAWVSQVYHGPDSTGLLVFAFEVAAWEGEITLEHEEVGGPVRRAEFVPYDEACSRVPAGSATPLRHWLNAQGHAPRIYWKGERTRS